MRINQVVLHATAELMFKVLFKASLDWFALSALRLNQFSEFYLSFNSKVEHY